MNKPQPTTRLAVEKYTENVIRIVYLDDESRDWVKQEAPAYGMLFDLDPQKALHLYPNKCYSIDEIVAFLKAGPTGEGVMREFGMLVTNNALHLHGGGMMEDSILSTHERQPSVTDESILANLAAFRKWRIEMEDVAWPDPAPAKTDALVALIFDDTSQSIDEDDTHDYVKVGRELVRLGAEELAGKNALIRAIIFDDAQPPDDDEDGVILDRANTLRKNAEILIEFFGKDRADEMAMEIKAILYPYGQ